MSVWQPNPTSSYIESRQSSYFLAWPTTILGPEDYSPSQSHVPFSITHPLLPPSSLMKQHGILGPAQCLRRMSYHLSHLPLLHPHLFTGGGNVHLSVLLVPNTDLTGAQYWSFYFLCLSSTWLSLGLCNSPLALKCPVVHVYPKWNSNATSSIKPSSFLLPVICIPPLKLEIAPLNSCPLYILHPCIYLYIYNIWLVCAMEIHLAVMLQHYESY